MTLPRAMAALAETWADVVGRLDDEQRVVLAGLLAEVLGDDVEVRAEAALEIMRLLARVLPRDHPVRAAFAAESDRYAGAALDWNPALRALSPHVPELRPLAGARQTPAEIQQGAERWLLAAPALDAAEVRRRGADPQDPGLIRLSPPGAGTRLPAFQFRADGQPHPVVAAINLLLDAGEDPWGVADWWLGPNAWIGAVPADVLGRLDDQILIEAARAVFEGA
jgi:hypothetical protein